MSSEEGLQLWPASASLQRPSTPPRPPAGPMLDPGTAAAVPATLAEHPIAEPAIPPSLVAEAEAEPPFAVSTRVVEVTPSRLDSPDVWLAGYATSHPEATGTARPLCRCLLSTTRVPQRPLDAVLLCPTSMNGHRVGVESLGSPEHFLLLRPHSLRSGPVTVLDPYSLLITERTSRRSPVQRLVGQPGPSILVTTRSLSRTPVVSPTASDAHESLPGKDSYLAPAVPTLGARTCRRHRVVALVFASLPPVARGFDGRYDAAFPECPGLLERASRIGGVLSAGAAGDQTGRRPQGPYCHRWALRLQRRIAAIASQMTR